MYCRNCGKEMDNKAVVCVECGCAAGSGNKYCNNCGKEVLPEAAACTHCGVALHDLSNGEQKSKLVAGLLGIFLGGLGIHNFYLGYTKKAVAQLLICLLGSCIVVGPVLAEIWGLIEGIMILCGKQTVDAKGVPLKD